LNLLCKVTGFDCQFASSVLYGLFPAPALMEKKQKILAKTIERAKVEFRKTTNCFRNTKQDLTLREGKAMDELARGTKSQIREERAPIPKMTGSRIENIDRMFNDLLFLVHRKLCIAGMVLSAKELEAITHALAILKELEEKRQQF
jgi:hypothetical protein